LLKSKVDRDIGPPRAAPQPVLHREYESLLLRLSPYSGTFLISRNTQATTFDNDRNDWNAKGF